MPGPGSNNTKDSNIVETMTCIVIFVDVIILLEAMNMSQQDDGNNNRIEHRKKDIDNLRKDQSFSISKKSFLVLFKVIL